MLEFLKKCQNNLRVSEARVVDEQRETGLADYRGDLDKTLIKYVIH